MSRQHKSARSESDRRTFLAQAAVGAAFMTRTGRVCLGADATKLPDIVSIHIPACWTSNLKLAVKAIIASPGNEAIRKEVRETPALPDHAAVVSFRPIEQLRITTPTAPMGKYDGYEWTTTDGLLVICGMNPRSAAFGIFEIARRLGLHWLTLLREPIYTPELAESIPERYQWRAAFPSTVVMLPADDVQRQCRWLLFHHWNTCWNSSIDVPPATGELVHSFGLKYQAGGHELNRAMPRKYFEERPDFFPIVRGKRTAELGDFAYGNPEAEEIVRREAAEIFRRHRDARGCTCGTTMSTSASEDRDRRRPHGLRRGGRPKNCGWSAVFTAKWPNQRLITLAYNRRLFPTAKHTLIRTSTCCSARASDVKSILWTAATATGSTWSF